MTIKLGKIVTYFDGFLPKKSHDPSITWSLEKLKPFYLYYQSAHGYQTWQDGNLPWWALSYKVASNFDHVVFWDHGTN